MNDNAKQRLRKAGASDAEISEIETWRARIKADPRAAGTPEFIAFAFGRRYRDLVAKASLNG